MIAQQAILFQAFVLQGNTSSHPFKGISTSFRTLAPAGAAA
jgi:hypothetical protein